MCSTEHVVATALEPGQAHALVAGEAAPGVLLRWPLLFLAGLLSGRRGCRGMRLLLNWLLCRTHGLRLGLIGRGHRFRGWARRWKDRAGWLPNIHPRRVQGRCRCFTICRCSLILCRALPVALGAHIQTGGVPIQRRPKPGSVSGESGPRGPPM